MRTVGALGLLLLPGCSVLASFSGLTGGPLACNGGGCDETGSDASVTKPDDGGGEDGGGNVTPDAAPLPVTFVMSGSRRVPSPGASTVTVSLPSAPAAGDYVVAVVLSDDASATITAQLGGWIAQTPPGIDRVPSGCEMAWFSRFATASEPASYTFDVPGNDTAAAAVAVYRGVDPASPVDASFNRPANGAGAFCGDTTPLPPPYTYSPTPTTCATPSITTTRGGDVIVLLYALDSDPSAPAPTWTSGGATLPGGVTAREDVGNVAIADAVAPSAGTSHLPAAKHSQTPGYAAVQLLALRSK